jgi:hypothetical protein
MLFCDTAPLSPARTLEQGQNAFAIRSRAIMRAMDEGHRSAAVARLRTALSAMEQAVSSRFTESLTRHGHEPEPADRTAVGTTDFRQRLTRMQSWIVSEAMQDMHRQGQAEAGPIARVILRGFRRLGNLAGNDRDMYFEPGQDWSYNPHTQKWSGGPRRSDGTSGHTRSWQDPIYQLDFLPAIIQVTGTGHGQTDYGQELTRFDAIADLRAADLPTMATSYLNNRLSALPLSVWLDADGLVRRLRYEATPPDAKTPMHRRLDFFEFGAPVRRPEIPEIK